MEGVIVDLLLVSFGVTVLIYVIYLCGSEKHGAKLGAESLKNSRWTRRNFCVLALENRSL